MPFLPYLARRLPLIEGLDGETLVTGLAQGDADLIARATAFWDDGAWEVPAPVAVSDETVPGLPPVRCYRTVEQADRVVVWAHGGGFGGGDLDMNEAHMVSAELAARTGATVLSVGYRLASTDVHHPLPVDDVCAVLASVPRRTDVAADARVVIGGASAGAALALAAAHRTPRAVDLVLLAYPFLHFPVPRLPDEVAQEMAALPPLLRFTPGDIEGMVENYVGRLHGIPAEALPGHVSPGPDHPPTRVLIAEYDDLRPSAELAVRQHRQAGVDVEVRMEPGVPHGHLNRLPAMPGVSESLDWLAGAVRDVGRR